MKKTILSASVMALVLLACNSNNDKTQKSTSTEITTMDTTTKPAVEQLYSCPMHPEVIGKKNENCSKCGMKLTVPVKGSETVK